jgi:DNA-binding NtrC family response regulator
MALKHENLCRFYMTGESMAVCTILVEDSNDIRHLLQSMMQELWNAEICAIARTSKDAISAIHRCDGRWNLLVLDLFLKEGSGLDVLKVCQRRPAHQHVVVLTNYPSAELRAKCLNLGAEEVFDKTTELDEFFNCCERWN